MASPADDRCPDHALTLFCWSGSRSEGNNKNTKRMGQEANNANFHGIILAFCGELVYVFHVPPRLAPRN